MILDWRDAHKDDRRGIQAFRCTTSPPKEPGRRARPHPKPWEYAVQKAIHQLLLPIGDADGRCLIGLAEDGSIGSLSLWCELRGEPGLFKSQIIAVSLQFRGTSTDPNQSGPVASEALDVTIEEMTKQGAGGRVFGLIHRSNSASQRLVRTHGFEVRHDFPVDDPDLQAWVARLPDGL